MDYAIKNFHDVDKVYLAEDDYFYTPKAALILDEGFSIADYVSGYDDPVKYVDGKSGGNPYGVIDGEMTRVVITAHHHWKFTNSCSMTFGVLVKTMKEDLEIYKKFHDAPQPHAMFIALQIQSKRKIVSPIPGVSTHGEHKFLSPFIDWSNQYNITEDLQPLPLIDVTKSYGTEHFYSQRVTELMKDCGDICNTSLSGSPSLFYPLIRKNVNCTGILLNRAIDAGRPTGPAPQIPKSYLPFFTYNGRVPILPYSGGIFNDQYLGGAAKSSVWQKELIEEWKRNCSMRNLFGNYGFDETNHVFDGLLRMQTVRGGHVLVIGSENPWVESCVLAAGASLVTTLEYGKIVSLHPQVNSITPNDMHNLFRSNKLPLFDAIVTFSSVEHSGLGRYGDELNPWGDLQIMARAWCVTKPRGELLIGVMTERGAVDKIEFNAHRVYGPLMFSHLLSNWKQKWRSPTGSQLVHILEKL